MPNRFLRSAVVAAVVLLAVVARPAAAQLPFEPSASVACVGVNGGCQLVDLFFALQRVPPTPQTAGLIWDVSYFVMNLTSPGWLFATMVNGSEGWPWESANEGGNYLAFVSGDRRQLVGFFSILLYPEDPDPTLRIRVAFDESTDASGLGFGYSFRDNDFNEIAAGEFHSTTTPEPVTLGLLAMGLAGVATARRRRRRNG
jgi:hypothetical protein